MTSLCESLLDEVQEWFSGNGRLLDTGPEIVDCYLSCKDEGEWIISELDSKSGACLDWDTLESRSAYHIILASDFLTLDQEQKVLCLQNLTL